MPARTAFRIVLVFVAVAVTVIGAVNVYGDNAEVVSAAASVACGAEGCAGSGPTRVERSAFAQSFEFVTRAGKTVAVECRRAEVLVGPYTCARP